MKKQVTREIEFCDICEKNEASYSKCLGCGKAICYDCRKAHATEYPHSIHFGSSDDGLYCNACVTRLKAGGGERLFDAYVLIADLRAESERTYKDIERRAKASEDAIKHLRKERGL